MKQANHFKTMLKVSHWFVGENKIEHASEKQLPYMSHPKSLEAPRSCNKYQGATVINGFVHLQAIGCYPIGLGGSPPEGLQHRRGRIPDRGQRCDSA